MNLQVEIYGNCDNSHYRTLHRWTLCKLYLLWTFDTPLMNYMLWNW